MSGDLGIQNSVPRNRGPLLTSLLRTPMSNATSPRTLPSRAGSNATAATADPDIYSTTKTVIEENLGGIEKFNRLNSCRALDNTDDANWEESSMDCSKWDEVTFVGEESMYSTAIITFCARTPIVKSKFMLEIQQNEAWQEATQTDEILKLYIARESDWDCSDIITIVIEYCAPFTLLHIMKSIMARDAHFREYAIDLMGWRMEQKIKDSKPRICNVADSITQTSSFRSPILDILNMDSL